MHYIFSTGSLYTYGMERCFALAAAAGFDGVELMVDQRWDTRQPDYLCDLVQRHGLPVRAVHSPFFRVPGWPVDPPGLIAKSVQLAEALGAAVVIHHLPVRLGYLFLQAQGRRVGIVPLPGWDMEGDYRRWLLDGYARLQASTDVTLCIENMPARRWAGCRLNVHHWNRPDRIVRFPSLTMDTTHLGTWGLEPVEIYRRWRGHVGHVHLSNFDGREHRRPEDGHLRLDALLAALTEDGFDGAVSFELTPDALDAGRDDDHLAHRLRHSLGLVRAWARPARAGTG